MPLALVRVSGMHAPALAQCADGKEALANKTMQRIACKGNFAMLSL
jgi:hypothetical protein